MSNPEFHRRKYDRYKACSFRAFNTWWPDRYDTHWWMRVFRVNDWDRSIIDGLQPDLISRPILDVGCATGRLLAKLAEHGASHVCGVDLAPRMLEKADQKLRHLGVSYELKVADAEDALPWPDGFFGAAVLSGVIHHFFRPKEALAEIHRVLAPQGWLYIVEPRLPLVVRQGVNSYLRFFSHDGDCRFYSPRALSALLEECGFAVTGMPAHPGRFSYLTVGRKR
jgi:ubiquinone/menaquinone biosynthesis C-methylase UbiE